MRFNIIWKWLINWSINFDQLINHFQIWLISISQFYWNAQDFLLIHVLYIFLYSREQSPNYISTFIRFVSQFEKKGISYFVKCDICDCYIHTTVTAFSVKFNIVFSFFISISITYLHVIAFSVKVNIAFNLFILMKIIFHVM